MDLIRQNMISLLISLSIGQWLDAVGILLVILGVSFAFVIRRKKFRHSDDPNDLMPIKFLKVKWRSKKKKQEYFWEYVLIFGLGLELLALAWNVPESLRLKFRVEELRKQNDELEAELNPRRITIKQMEDFKLFMTFVSKKIPIRISIGQEGFDTETFGKDMRDMFNYAGFSATPDCGVWGLFRDNTRVTTTMIWETNRPFAEIVYFATNSADFNFNPTNRGIPFMWHYIPSPYTNFSIVPVVPESGSAKDVFDAIDIGLKQIKIPAYWFPENQWVKSNEFEIFIPVKNQ